MYVALSDLQGFSILDLPSKTVVGKVTIPSMHHKLHPWKFETQDTLTHGLALTPDGEELWVTSLLDNSVYIYDLRSNKVVGKVRTGIGPNWVVITPDGKYVCVSSTDTDTVSIIDTAARREVARIKVGEVPKRLALAPAFFESQGRFNQPQSQFRTLERSSKLNLSLGRIINRESIIEYAPYISDDLSLLFRLLR